MNFNILGLELTKACQNRCTYCYNQETKIQNLSARDIEKAIQIYDEQLINSLPLKLSLLGGEPLIRKKIFLPVLKNLQKNTLITLNTNGLLLDKKNCSELSNTIQKVALSLDGPAIIHDLNRKTAKNQPTYNLVLKNLPYILDYFEYVFCQATFTPNTIAHLSDSYFLAKELGFKEWYWAPDIYQHTWSEKDYEILEQQMNIIAKDYFLNKNPQMIYKPFEKEEQERNMGNLRFDKTSHVLLAQADKRLKISRLNATQISNILDEDWYIGTITTGIDKNKLLNWEEKYGINADQYYYAYNQLSICKNCVANNICYNSNHNDQRSYLYAIQCMQPRIQCEQKKIIMTIRNSYLKNQ